MTMSELSSPKMSDDAEEDEEETWLSCVMRLGVYPNCKLLAKGGMGAAFSVIELETFARRALKLALPDEGDDDIFLEEANS